MGNRKGLLRTQQCAFGFPQQAYRLIGNSPTTVTRVKQKEVYEQAFHILGINNYLL
jgi:hypothetical protein